MKSTERGCGAPLRPDQAVGLVPGDRFTIGGLPGVFVAVEPEGATQEDAAGLSAAAVRGLVDMAAGVVAADQGNATPDLRAAVDWVANYASCRSRRDFAAIPGVPAAVQEWAAGDSGLEPEE